MTGVVVCCPVQPTGDERKADWTVPRVIVYLLLITHWLYWTAKSGQCLLCSLIQYFSVILTHYCHHSVLALYKKKQKKSIALYQMYILVVSHKLEGISCKFVGGMLTFL